MKATKLLAAFALVALSIGTARAVPINYSFEFHSETPSDFDGSTITITNTGSEFELTGWNLLGWSGGAVNNSNSTTNSPFINVIPDANSTTWQGLFYVSGFAGGPFSPTGTIGNVPFFQGSNVVEMNGEVFGNLNLFSFSARPDQPQVLGSWTPFVPSVPDAGSSVQLLGIALGGLGVCRRWISARA